MKMFVLFRIHGKQAGANAIETMLTGCNMTVSRGLQRAAHMGIVMSHVTVIYLEK